MQGLIQSSPLTVDRILRHAAQVHGQAEVVTAIAEGAPRRSSYVQLESRVHRLAGALVEIGIGKGDTVAVIGASSGRQLEAWFAVMSAGAVCQAISPALGAETTAALMRGLGAKAVMVDPELLEQLEPVLLKLPQLERVIAMSEAGQVLPTRMTAVVSQDALLEMAGRPLANSRVEESGAALLLHGAGATEALATRAWSHRSCVLQALAAQGSSGLDLTAEDNVLVLVPFWRCAGGGALFAGPVAGARLVLPGSRTDAQSVRVLADRESATVVIGSPAELQALHDQFRAENRRPTAIRRIVSTGAPTPPALARAWRDSFAIDLWTAWGAAEVAGVAAVGRGAAALSPLFGVDLDLLDADGRPRPHDGVAIGRLAAHGPLVPMPEGATYVDTGDLATIDAQGRVALLGRADEQVTAQGLQVPSWPIEAAALEHPASARAAVIDPPRGLPPDGPVLVIERKPGALAGKPEYLRFLAERLGGLKLGELLFVNGFPLDPAGRIDKSSLRQRLERVMAPQLEPRPEPPLQTAPAPEPAPPPRAASVNPAAILSAPALAAAAAAPPVLFKEELPGTPAPAAEESRPDLTERSSAESTAEAALPEPSPEAPPEPPAVPEPLSIGPLGPSAQGPETLGAASAAGAAQDPGLFLHLDKRPHQERKKDRGREGRSAIFLNLMAFLGLTPALLILAGALAVRFGLLDWRVGVEQLILDWPAKLALIAILGGIFAMFAAMAAGFGRYGLRAAFALVLPLTTLAGLVWLRSLGDSYPPVHDVATDWSQPLQLSPALIRARGPDAYPVEDDPFVPATAGTYMNRRVADVNTETCPGARPVVLVAPPAQAYARAKAALLAQGLELFTDNPSGGRLEAVATDPWLGLKDDVAVRVQALGAGSRVDLRSISRGGVADYGSNCRRVSELVRAIGPSQGSAGA